MGTVVVRSDGNPNLIDGWIFLGIKKPNVSFLQNKDKSKEIIWRKASTVLGLFSLAQRKGVEGTPDAQEHQGAQSTLYLPSFSRILGSWGHGYHA